MILYPLEILDRKTHEAIQKNNDRYARGEIGDEEHEQTYEKLMDHWRMETEHILSLRKNPFNG